MSTLMWVVLYFVVGIVMAIIASRSLRIDRGYSVRDFDDLDEDEQGLIMAFIFLWPIMIFFFAIYAILNGITKITNRKDDDSK